MDMPSSTLPGSSSDPSATDDGSASGDPTNVDMPDTGGATPGSSPSANGSFTVSVSLSDVIQTVGVVEWSTTEAIESAVVQFGREQGSVEFEAPVDLTEPNYRTLLLGMKPDTTYYVQVVAEGGGATYASDFTTLQTGFLPNGLPQIDVNDQDAAASYGGFTINCTGVAGGGAPGGGGFGGGLGGLGGGMDSSGASSWVFAFDKDGDYVWAYDIGDTDVASCSRARMSYDGKHMWIGNFSNVSPDGALQRVSMDGQNLSETYSFPGRHHDFAILPNGHVLFYEQENGGGYTDGSEGPDIISEFDPDTGTVTEIYHENTHFQAQIDESGAHTNQINYVPELNAISFSLRHTSTIGLISYPDAELLAVFGGPISTFDMEWDVQHGHHVTDGRVLIFNNNGSNGGSSVLEYEYDLTSQSAALVLDYSSGNSSGAFGDVKRLPNGNIFVTYSTSGVIHEIDANGSLLREFTMDSIGYSEHRKTLYGPPPPFGD